MKLLHSEAGDTAQLTHTDYVPSNLQPSKLLLKKFHYSAFISIEENTELLVGESRLVVKIPLYSIHFFRGDMLHAGAGNVIENSSLRKRLETLGESGVLSKARGLKVKALTAL